MTLREVIQNLAPRDLQLAAEIALAEQVEAIAEAARVAGADHGEVRVSGAEASIGWRSPVSRLRERGVAGTPPQSVLASVVASHGASAADAVTAAVANVLREG